MKAREALIAWTPAHAAYRTATAGQVKVGPLLREGDIDWAHDFMKTGGAAYIETRQLEGDAARFRLFSEFHTMVVRDGIDPQVAHKAFLQIDEYAFWIAPDIPGARVAD